MKDSVSPSPTGAQLIVDEHDRTVTWWLAGAAPGATVSIPWGELALAEPAGAGQVLLVVASEAFLLVVHNSTTSFAEPISPGKHRLVLTRLDRTDVAGS